VEGWWWFFPFAFLVKTPVASLLLFFFSFVALALWKWLPRNGTVFASEAHPLPKLYDLSPLLILGGVYGATCLTSHLDIGLRHLMPVYPVLFVLAGANVFWLRARKPLFKIALAALLMGTMIESLFVWPNYLAFFNPLVGGPRNGYKYLVDSSLDWGQDLPGLHQWLEKDLPAENGAPFIWPISARVTPGSTESTRRYCPAFFDIETPQTFPLQGGVYCLSATMLQCVYSALSPAVDACL